MYVDEIKRKIFEFRAIGVPPLFLREKKILEVPNSISTIVGVRRSGKSTHALQFANAWLKESPDRTIEDICHLDFDNPVFATMQATDLKNIITTFLQISKNASLNRSYLYIFDELHRIEGWEDFAVEVSRNHNWKVVVTGSSNKSLRSDLATSLRGKSISTHIWPLSFKEFLNARQIPWDSHASDKIAKVKSEFEGYLYWGGFPALANLAIPTREPLLHDYFDAMLLRDIIDKNRISKTQQCTFFLRHVMSQMARPFTIKSAFDLMKQKQLTTSREALSHYLTCAQDSYLVEETLVQSDSTKEQLNNYSKIYPVDWGLANFNAHVWDGNHSRALETLVYIHLRRQGFLVNYYRTKSTHLEIDFLVSNRRGKIEQAIQVCFSTADKSTLARELKPLAPTLKFFGIQESLILTNDEEGVIEHDGIKTRIFPVWKWLLN